MKDKKGLGSKNTAFAFRCIPENYDIYDRIDLTRDKKAIRLIIIWTLLVVAGMIIPMLYVHPVSEAFGLSAGRLIAAMLASIIGLIIYIPLHEWVHGVFIRLFTGESASFKIELKKGMICASSSWLFKKVPYVIVAAAPVLVWAVIIGILLCDIEEKYFWFLYVVQIFNVTGSAGDLYVICMAMRMPANVLISDSGAAMNFFLEKKI